MTEPLARVEYSYAPRYAFPGFQVAGYQGDYVVLVTANSVLFVHARTGERQMVGLAMTNDRPPISGPYPGMYTTGQDTYQFIDGLLVSDRWVLVRGKPERGWHDRSGNLAGHLQIIRDRAYFGQMDLPWYVKRSSVVGDRAYLITGWSGGRGEETVYQYAEVDLPTKAVVREVDFAGLPPTHVAQTSIDGYKYTITGEGLFNNTMNEQRFILTRSDQAVVEPTTPPAPQPTPPTPTPEVPTVPTPPTEPAPLPTCGPGEYYNIFTRRCEKIVAAPTPASPPSSMHAVYLHGHYLTEVDFAEPGQPNRKATPIPFNEDTAFFWFLSPNNIELGVVVVDTERPGQPAVKLLPGTNLYFRVTVTDQASGKRWVYQNPQGQMAGVVDWGAFA